MALPLLPLLLLGGAALFLAGGKSKGSSSSTPTKTTGPCKFVVVNGVVTTRDDGTCSVRCKAGFTLVPAEPGGFPTCKPDKNINECDFIVENGSVKKLADGTCEITCVSGYVLSGNECIKITEKDPLCDWTGNGQVIDLGGGQCGLFCDNGYEINESGDDCVKVTYEDEEPDPQPDPGQQSGPIKLEPSLPPKQDPQLDPLYDCEQYLAKMLQDFGSGEASQCKSSGRLFPNGFFSSPELTANIVNSYLFCAGLDSEIQVSPEDLMRSDAYGSSANWWAASSSFEPGGKPQSIKDLQSLLAGEPGIEDGAPMYQGTVDGIWGNCTMSAIFEAAKQAAANAFFQGEDEEQEETLAEKIASGEIPSLQPLVANLRLEEDINKTKYFFISDTNWVAFGNNTAISVADVLISDGTTNLFNARMPTSTQFASTSYIDSKPKVSFNKAGLAGEIELGYNSYSKKQYIKTLLTSGTNIPNAVGSQIVVTLLVAPSKADAAAGQNLSAIQIVQPAVSVANA